ncbi:hypothetical protein [Paenibacillus sp. IITD108]|uniref:hypothetical protein n=1 Tax=Paenibacillus sp. IITD108 TaxID=3116649 RepID=UPI002F3F59D0
MKTVNELILERLKEEFERNGYNPAQQMFDDNVWVMTAAVIPFEEELEVADLLPYSLEDVTLRESYLNQGKPTHIVRVVLRTNGSYGLCEYVDGTDVYFSVDRKKQKADCLVWSDTWVEGPPKFEGGSVESSLSWVRRMGEPFIIFVKDPFI